MSSKVSIQNLASQIFLHGIEVAEGDSKMAVAIIAGLLKTASPETLRMIAGNCSMAKPMHRAIGHGLRSLADDKERGLTP